MDSITTANSITVAQIGSRDLFPELAPRAYLSFAAVSPPSTAVQYAIRTMLTHYAREGAGAIGAAIAQRERLRGKLAQLIQAHPDEVALVRNTSEGALDIAFSLEWRPGDGVILFKGEFPANVSAWLQAAALFNLKIFWLNTEDMTHPGGLAQLQALLAEEQIRLVAISAVQFQTGWRMPVAEISEAAHRAGAQVFVDCIQACGCIPISMETWRRVDFMACSGHKWLMGIEGAGFLYIRRTAQPSLNPRLVGWLSGENAFDFLFQGPGLLHYERPLRARADVFEGSSPAALGYAALEASVDILLALDISKIFAHITAYLEAFSAGLQALGLPNTRRVGCESGIVSIPVADGARLAALHKALGAAGVACSTPDGHLRFAPHWPNSLDEIPFVLETLHTAWSKTPG